MLDEMENASKFSIILEYKYPWPCRFFHFSFHATLVVEMKYEENYMGFPIPKVWQILMHFIRSFHQAHSSYF